MSKVSKKKTYLPTKSIISKTKKWLGKNGISFFSKVLEDHGTLIAVWMDGGIPHPVHFREGMTVRNFLRGLKETKGWDAHDYDNRWEKIVIEAIKKKEEE